MFVDGCFWHGCPAHGSRPTTNSAYWSEKVARNQARDLDTTQALEEAGWTVVRVWEHHIPVQALALVETALQARST